MCKEKLQQEECDNRSIDVVDDDVRFEGVYGCVSIILSFLLLFPNPNQSVQKIRNLKHWLVGFIDI